MKKVILSAVAAAVLVASSTMPSAAHWRWHHHGWHHHHGWYHHHAWAYSPFSWKRVPVSYVGLGLRCDTPYYYSSPYSIVDGVLVRLAVSIGPTARCL
jgi:hypothetical protein